MQLNNQFAPVELCKQLLENYQLNEARLSWVLDRANSRFTLSLQPFEAIQILNVGRKDEDKIEAYPAFSVAELGQMLNDLQPIVTVSFYNPHRGEWQTVVVEQDSEGEEKYITDGEGETEAESRIDAVLYLLEKGLVTVEKFKERLAA